MNFQSDITVQPICMDDAGGSGVWTEENEENKVIKKKDDDQILLIIMIINNTRSINAAVGVNAALESTPCKVYLNASRLLNSVWRSSRFLFNYSKVFAWPTNYLVKQPSGDLERRPLFPLGQKLWSDQHQHFLLFTSYYKPLSARKTYFLRLFVFLFCHEIVQ